MDDLYEDLAHLYNHLVAGHDWSEDDAARLVDGILYDNRTRKDRQIDLAWKCYNLGCLGVIGGVTETPAVEVAA